MLSLQKKKSLFYELAPLFVILILAVGLRLIFVTGMVFWDDFQYSQLAYNLSQGILPEGGWEGSARILFYGPVAILYVLFGVNDITTLAFPFVSSLIGVILVYFIARLLAGEAAGLLAMLLWAITPLNVSTATMFLTDGPLATFTLASVLFFLLAQRQQNRFVAYATYGTCALFLCLSTFIKPSGLTIIFFFAAYIAWRWVSERQINQRVIMVFILTFVAVILLYYLYEGYFQKSISPTAQQNLLTLVASTATDWFSNLVSESEFYALTPLFIVAIAVSLVNIKKEAVILLLWLGTTFLYFELGSMSLNQYEPVPYGWMPRQLLFILPPFVILAGIYLSQTLFIQYTRWLICALAFIIGVIAWLGSLGAPAISWNLTGQAISSLPFTTLSRISTALVIFSSIVSPLFVLGKQSRLKQGAVSGLLLCLGLGLLSPTYMSVTINKGTWKVDYPKVLQIIQKYPDFPLWIQNSSVGARLNYLASYKLGFDYFNPNVQMPSSRIRLAPADFHDMDNGFVLVDKMFFSDATWGAGPDYLSNPPSTWLKYADISDTVDLYFFSREMSAENIKVAQSVVHEHPDKEGLFKLMKMADDAGDYCMKVSAWEVFLSLEPDVSGWYDPVKDMGHCYTSHPDIAGPNLIINANFSKGLAGWYHDSSWGAVPDVVVDTDNITPILEINFEGGDPKVIRQDFDIKPDTWYVYDMVIKSSASVTTLYMETDTSQFLEQGKIYPDWTYLYYVFKTPHWDGNPHHVFLYPIFLSNRGLVWIKQCGFFELEIGLP